jgi:hypothetical protein
MVPTSSNNQEEKPVFSGTVKNSTTTNEAVGVIPIRNILTDVISADSIPAKAVSTDAITVEAVKMSDAPTAAVAAPDETPGGDAIQNDEAAVGVSIVNVLTASDEEATKGNATAEAVSTLDAVGKTAKKRASKKAATKKAKKAATERKTRSSERTAEDTKVNSIRLTVEGEAALLVLKTLHPKKTKIDLISDALQVAARMIAAPPVIRFATLDGGELVRVQGAIAKSELILGSFRKDLIQIEKKSDSFEQLAVLVTKTEMEIAGNVQLRERLEKLSMLPETLTPENLGLLRDLQKFLQLWEKDVSADESPLLGIALKLLTPYLP